MFLLFLACSGAPEVPPAAPQPAKPPPAAPPEPVAEATPPEIVVLNDTDTPLTLDRSFGPAAPIRIAAEGGRPLPGGTVLDDVDDAHSSNRILLCECDCAVERECPECEAPGDVKVTLAPGESYTVPWNGKLRAWLLDDRCATRFQPMAWPYVLTACSEDGVCGRTVLTLPSSEPVVIRLGQSARAETCAAISDTALRRAGTGAWTMTGRSLRDRPVSDCPPEPTCVEPADEDAFFAAARESACTSAVIPRGDRLEAVIFLPLPEGMRGGERYTHFYDPDATRLLDVRYEQ